MDELGRLQPPTSHRAEQRAIEDRAAAVAAYVLKAKARRVDLGRGQVHDFDLVFRDRVEPLEVTRHAHRPTLETQARLARQGMTHELGLAHAWFVSVPFSVSKNQEEGPLDVQACMRELEPLLRLLDQLGIGEFDTRALHRDPRLRPFAAKIERVGVWHGHSYPAGDPNVTQAGGGAGTLTLFASGVGSVERDAFVTAVESEAHEPGNVAKLAAVADATRRHLFVPIDVLAEPAYSSARQAFDTGVMPRLPELPDAITTVGVCGALHGDPSRDAASFLGAPCDP